MNTTSIPGAVIDASPHPSMLETLLTLGLLALLSVGAWNLFASMPAYGATPSAHAPVVAAAVATPPPACFNHTREQILAQDAQAMADIARGCPSDPMAYSSATLHQVQD